MFKNSKKFKLNANTALQTNTILFKITSADRGSDRNRE